MKKACTVSIISGIILILGATGGCDFESTSLMGAIILMICGITLVLSGLLLPKYIIKRRYILRARTHKVLTKSAFSQQKRTASAKEIAKARKSFVLIKEI